MPRRLSLLRECNTDTVSLLSFQQVPRRLLLSLCVNVIPILYFFPIVSANALENFTFSVHECNTGTAFLPARA